MRWVYKRRESPMTATMTISSSTTKHSRDGTSLSTAILHARPVKSRDAIVQLVSRSFARTTTSPPTLQRPTEFDDIRERHPQRKLETDTLEYETLDRHKSLSVALYRLQSSAREFEQRPRSETKRTSGGISTSPPSALTFAASSGKRTA